MATIFAIPTSAPQDAATSELLDRLRDETIPQATQGTALADKVFIGGAVPVFEDLSDKVASRLPMFIATVIGLSVLLLIMAFRSLWIPLVSALFNLLSVGAAYGVVVAVFQEGHRRRPGRLGLRTCRSSRSSRSCCSRSCSA